MRISLSSKSKARKYTFTCNINFVFRIYICFNNMIKGIDVPKNDIYEIETFWLSSNNFARRKFCNFMIFPKNLKKFLRNEKIWNTHKNKFLKIKMIFPWMYQHTASKDYLSLPDNDKIERAEEEQNIQAFPLHFLFSLIFCLVNN